MFFTQFSHVLHTFLSPFSHEKQKNAFFRKIFSIYCSMFRCPRELDSWSGEISAIEVYSIDDDYNRIDFVGYWTTEEELKETTDGY